MFNALYANESPPLLFPTASYLGFETEGQMKTQFSHMYNVKETFCSLCVLNRMAFVHNMKYVHNYLSALCHQDCAQDLMS